MIRRNYLILIVLFGALCFFACTNGPAANKENDEIQQGVDRPQSSPPIILKSVQQIKTTTDIQSAYAEVVSKLEVGALDSSAFSYDCRKEKNGSVTYYAENGKLRLIVHSYNEYDHFSAVDQYFVKDSILFFVHSKHTTWAFESGPEGSTRDDITEKRSYFLEGQAILCLEKKYVIQSQIPKKPNSEAVPNRIVKCSASDVFNAKYQLLGKYRFNPASGCLE